MSLIRALFIVLFSSLGVILVGCTPSLSPDVYSGNSADQVSSAVKGVIVSRRTVTVADDFNASGGGGSVGTFTGAALGGLAGSQLGGGFASNAAGAVGGAVLGGIIGNAAQKRITRQTGIQYVIKRRNGSLISVVQGKDPQLYQGQHVLVIYSKNRPRVIPDSAY